jgi:hypothetical protein
MSYVVRAARVGTQTSVGISTKPGLHVCPACGSNLVQPLDFEPLGASSCYVELLCPNCHWSHRGVHHQAEVDRFDEELERGEAAVLASVEELTRTNMRDEADRFARALAADAILPMDF